MADKEGLTASEVQKRFGVKPVTYYSWRKKVAAKRRASLGSEALKGVEFGSEVRRIVRARIETWLLSIVRAEVNNYVDAILGPVRRERVGA